MADCLNCTTITYKTESHSSMFEVAFLTTQRFIQPEKDHAIEQAKGVWKSSMIEWTTMKESI